MGGSLGVADSAESAQQINASGSRIDSVVGVAGVDPGRIVDMLAEMIGAYRDDASERADRQRHVDRRFDELMARQHEEYIETRRWLVALTVALGALSIILAVLIYDRLVHVASAALAILAYIWWTRR